MTTMLSYSFQDTWSTLIQDPETASGYLQLNTPLITGALHSSHQRRHAISTLIHGVPKPLYLIPTSIGCALWKGTE